MSDEKPTAENGGLEITAPQEPKPSSQQYLEVARKKLGITYEALATQPRVTHWFQNIGGKEIAIEYLRGSLDADAQKFITLYDRVSNKDRQHLTFEDFCVAAGVRSENMLAAIVKNVVPMSEKISAVMAAKFHPEITQVTIDSARIEGPQGFKDRELLHKHAGFVPVPKGAQVAVQVNTQVNSSKDQLPPIEQDIKDLSEGFQKLGSGKDE